MRARVRVCARERVCVCVLGRTGKWRGGEGGGGMGVSGRGGAVGGRRTSRHLNAGWRKCTWKHHLPDTGQTGGRLQSYESIRQLIKHRKTVPVL